MHHALMKLPRTLLALSTYMQLMTQSYPDKLGHMHTNWCHLSRRLMLLKANMPADVEAELNTKAGTVTPWWFAIKTLAKVSINQ